MVEPAQTVPLDVRAQLTASAAGEGTGLRAGLWVSYLDPYGLEVVLGHGPDWIGVDLQHGNLELTTLPGLLRVAEAAGLPLLARTPSHDPGTIGRTLDYGVSGVIVPMVESAEQALAVVAACRTPPLGSRSTGGCRSSLGVSQAPAEQLVLPMVETAAGLKRAAEIPVGSRCRRGLLRPLRFLDLGRLPQCELAGDHRRSAGSHRLGPDRGQDGRIHGRPTGTSHGGSRG